LEHFFEGKPEKKLEDLEKFQELLFIIASDLE